MAADEQILAPFQPNRPPHMKTVNVKVDVKHHAIPSMLMFLSRFALGILGVGSTIVMFAYPAGSPADIAGTIAFFAWNTAAVLAIMDHIISKQPSTRQEVIEEITRAQKTHLTIR